MKILLAGAAGQLGHTLRRQLPSAGSRRQLSIHKKGRELTVGELGPSHRVGGAASNGTTRERTNKQMVEAICSDRGGHDRRYAIGPTRISTERGRQRAPV